MSGPNKACIFSESSIMRITLEQLLKREQADFFIAEPTPEHWDVAAGLDCKLLLVDEQLWQQPSFRQQWEKREKHAQIPVVLLGGDSASGNEQVVRESIELPISPSGLIHRLRPYLGTAGAANE